MQPRGAAAERDAAGVDVGIVFDVGGRGDKSFNDGAYKGADSAKAVLGADIRFIEPGEGSDREAGLRLLAAQGMDLVIGVGFIFTDDLSDLAVEYPSVSFAGVDYALTVDVQGNVVEPPSNLAALKFREEEGSFLVGAIAVLAGGSKRLGFVAAGYPLIHKFEAGYRAGVRHVCRLHRDRQYAGLTPEVPQSGPGKGAGAQSVPVGRQRHLPRVRLHGARRVRGGAADPKVRHRGRCRSVRRSAGIHHDVDGEGGRRRDVRRDTTGARGRVSGWRVLVRLEGGRRRVHLRCQQP